MIVDLFHSEGDLKRFAFYPYTEAEMRTDDEEAIFGEGDNEDTPYCSDCADIIVAELEAEEYARTQYQNA